MSQKVTLRVNKARRARFRKAGIKVSPFATKAFVKKQITKQQESKFHDTAIDLVSAISTHTPVLLNLIAGGTTSSTRIGNDIQLQSLQFKLQAQPHLTTATAAHCKVIIFRWFDNTDPVDASIFLTSGVTRPVSLNNVTTNGSKYQMLYTRTFNINVGAAANDHIMFEKFLKLKGKAKWSSGTDTATLTGNVFLQIVSDLAANGPDIHIKTRLRYTEA